MLEQVDKLIYEAVDNVRSGRLEEVTLEFKVTVTPVAIIVKKAEVTAEEPIKS